MEDYRAPFDANFAGSILALRNSFVEGVSAIFSSLALVLGVLFEFGLPLFFWTIILFWPYDHYGVVSAHHSQHHRPRCSMTQCAGSAPNPLSNFLDSVLPVMVIFALEISGLRQLCCRFFLSPPYFPAVAQQQAHCSPFALSASKDRANKSFIFMFLQAPRAGNTLASLSQSISCARFCKNGGGGIFSRAKKTPETDKPSRVSTFLVVILAL